jgi:hypothetical protein
MLLQYMVFGDNAAPRRRLASSRSRLVLAGRLVGAAVLAAGCLFPTLAPAQRTEPRPLSLYGDPGMIDMPSARLMDDGAFALTAETKQPDDRITIAFQVLPWLEGTARYSVIYQNGADNTLYDRSLGFRIRLMEEGINRPALAVGVLDMGGTLVFGGEYFVASKKFGFVDASLGLGFGRLGSRGQFSNPLGLLSRKFKNRPAITSIEDTGRLGVKQLFRGEDVSLFGGVVIDTPIRGLQLLAEYSGDDYVREQNGSGTKVLTPVNFGVSYRPLKSVETGLALLQGHIVAGRISLRTNFKNPPSMRKLDPPAPEIHVRSDEELRRGLAELLSARSPSAGGSGQGDATSKFVNRAELANAPDWTVYPMAFAGVTPDERPAASLRERLDAALEPIRYRISEARAEGTTLVFELSPTALRGQLQCDEIWPLLPRRGFEGFEAVNFREAGRGPADLRCTKFLSPAGEAAPAPEAQVPEVSVPLVTRGLGWWEERAVANQVANQVATTLKRQGLAMESAKLTAQEAIIHFSNPNYQSAGRALGRAARALTHVLPPSIETITLVLTTGALNGTRLAIPRAALERAAKSIASPEEILTVAEIGPAPVGLPRGSFKPNFRFPAFKPIFAPSYRHSLFDPDDPMRYQLFWRAGGSLELFRGVSLGGAYALDIYNNFDTIARVSDSVLPHVRSDTAQYLKRGSTGIANLELVVMRQLAPELYGRLSVGYFEEMFGGADAEILYRPFGRRWAIGIEAAQAYQRDYDRGFGFRDYNITTGHVSLYYESPYYGLNFNVHAGRYLAGDWGATFEMARRFDNGAEVGVFATLTDVPFKTYGEGSFDKGIVVRFPFDLISFFSTRQMANLTLRPLTRDGGARLAVNHRLYEETRPVSYGDVQRNWGDFLAYH